MANPKAHQRYYVNGKRVVNASGPANLLDPGEGLRMWYYYKGIDGENPQEIFRQSGKRGTLAHTIIEKEWGGPEPDYENYSKADIESAENAVLSYYEWAKDHTLEPILIEGQMVSEKYMYGGTCDFYGKLDGKLTLIDLKTSSGIYENYYYQLAAYWNLLVENEYKVEQVAILRVGREEDEGFEFRVIPMEILKIAWQVFRLLLKIYYLKKKVRA